MYLLKKFIVRNRVASIIAFLLLIIIVSTSFISLYSYGRAQEALKQSLLKQDAYKTQTKRMWTFNQQLALASFLELWHDDKIRRAAGFVPHLIDKTRERIAAEFLLIPKPLTEKQDEFKARLPKDESSFMAFVIGEYHLKNNNKEAAIESYNKCLEKNKYPSELDDWFINRTNRQLDVLLNRKVSINFCPTDETEK